MISCDTIQNRLFRHHSGLETPLLVGTLVSPLTCHGQCFKEFIKLEDMVNTQDELYFCKPKYDGCDRKTVNVYLPKRRENGKPNYNHDNYTDEGSQKGNNSNLPTVSIVITAILSILLTLSIVGIVLKVLRYN